MKRSTVVVFAILSLLGIAVAGFLQSAQFADMIKNLVSKRVPTEWGIEGDFKELRIGLFPPTLAIIDPKVKLGKHNIANLPEGSRVSAERMELRFYLLQLLSGSFRVHEAVIINGDVDITIDQKFLSAPTRTREEKKPFLSWREIVDIRADAVIFEDTRVQVHVKDPKISARFLAKRLKVAQAFINGLWGMQLVIALSEMEGEYPKTWKLPSRIDALNAFVQLSLTGASIQKARLEAEGLLVSGSARISGDVFNPKQLELKGDLSLDADLKKLIPLLGLRLDGSGKVKFAGKVDGDLSRFEETLEATGKLEGDSITFQGWGADHFEVDGSWSAANRREIKVNRGYIREAPAKRVPGESRARGGEILVGSFQMPLGSSEAITVPVEFREAHLHWLGAPAIKGLFPLDFRLSGSAKIEVIPQGPSSEIQARANLDLKIPEFQFDNQRLQLKRPLSRIVATKDMQLKGAIEMDSKGVRPDGLELVFRKSRFALEGQVDFKKGLSLTARGKVDLADLDALAETKPTGAGKLNVVIRGGQSKLALDFDCDLQSASILRLNLGNLKGQMTWDDEVEELLFKKTELHFPRSMLIAEGAIKSKSNSIDVHFGLKRADVSDIIWIFDFLVNDKWWFPHSMIGATEGVFHVTGKLATDQLKVDAKLNASEWLFMGERFESVIANFGYNSGRYTIDQLSARKTSGTITARAAFDSQSIQWDFFTQGMTLRDVDWISRLDIPVRGSFQIKSKGQMVGGWVRSETSAWLRDLSLRGENLLPSELLLTSESGIVTAEGHALGETGRMDFIYDFTPKGSSFVRVEMDRFRFGPVLMLFNSSLAKDPEFQSSMTGLMELRFKTGQFEFGNGQFSIKELLLSKTGQEIRLAKNYSSSIVQGTFDLSGMQFKGNHGLVTLDLRASQSRLSGGIKGSVDLGLIEFLTSAVRRATGVAKLDLAVAGTIKEPSFVGPLELSAPSVDFSFLDSPIENLKGLCQFKGTSMVVKDFDGRLASGRVGLKGQVEFYPTKVPDLDLILTLTDNRLKFYPFLYAQTSGNIRIHGQKIPYLMEGKVQILDALSRERFLARRTSRARKLSRFAPVEVGFGERPELFSLKVQADAPRGILIKSDIFDGELKGKLELSNTFEVPRIQGQVEALNGKLFFKDHQFALESGKIVFDNPTSINPRVNLTSFADIKNTRVKVVVSGDLDDLKIELSSEPSMAEQEILSLLAVGYTSEDLRRLKTSDQAAIQQSEAASLLLHSLDFNRDIKERTGLQVTLDESTNPQAGTSIFRPQTGAESGAAPKIVIRRNIDERVDVSVGTTVGVGTTTQREVSAEVHVAPGLSVIGIWNSYEGASAQEQQTSYGVDFKVQKRFR